MQLATALRHWRSNCSRQRGGAEHGQSAGTNVDNGSDSSSSGRGRGSAKLSTRAHSTFVAREDDDEKHEEKSEAQTTRSATAASCTLNRFRLLLFLLLVLLPLLLLGTVAGSAIWFFIARRHCRERARLIKIDLHTHRHTLTQYTHLTHNSARCTSCTSPQSFNGLQIITEIILNQAYAEGEIDRRVREN